MQPLNIQVRAATIADLEQILAFIHQKAAFDGFRDPVAATIATLQQTLDLLHESRGMCQFIVE